MAESLPQKLWVDEGRLIALARELALDILPLETILKNTGTTLEEFETIVKLPRFQHLLVEATGTWTSSLNSGERIKVKAMAQLEDWLPELHQRLHDPKETLTAKIEGGKLLRSLAGIAEKGTELQQGERFSLTINIGDGKPVEVTQRVTQTIEGEIVP